MGRLPGFFLLLLVLATSVRGTVDAATELSNWAFEECSQRVEKARKSNPQLVRGICETVEELVSTFVDFAGNDCANRLGMAFSTDIGPRMMQHPYLGQAKEAINNLIGKAIEKNSREDGWMADELDLWGRDWAERAAQDSDNSPIERVSPEKLEERIAQFRRAKEEEL